MVEVIEFKEQSPPMPTDRQSIEACAALVLCLNPGQEARLSRLELERLVRLARAGLAERQTRPA